MTLGPHWMKVLKNRSRSGEMNSAGKHTSHEENEGVEEGQNSKTPGRLEEQVDREPCSGPRSPVIRIGSDECDVLLHAKRPGGVSCRYSGCRTNRGCGQEFSMTSATR